MKRLKKAALAVACAAVLCSVFSGCGGDKKDTAKARRGKGADRLYGAQRKLKQSCHSRF